MTMQDKTDGGANAPGRRTVDAVDAMRMRVDVAAFTRKVYRYQLENEPERNITMQCIEYQLSTRAGRPGCG